MKKIFYCLIISFIIRIIFTEDELRWTFELINHGARTPHLGLDSNLKDFTNHTWIGQNELTGVGLRQSFLIGYRDRLRYIEEKKLISEEYDPRDILIYASENNKTLMSASALLHGLFLPGTGPQIDPDLVDRAVPPVDPSSYLEEKNELDNCNYTALPGRMNLVPVHIFFSHEYMTQYENSKKCIGLKPYEEKNKNRDGVKEFLEKVNKKYGKKLINIFKDKDENNILKDYEFAYIFFDTIICLYFEGVEEFDNMVKLLEIKEEELLKDCYDFLFLNTVGNGIDNDKDFINYLVSPIFHKILNYMDYRIEKDKNGEKNFKGYDLPKYFILSGISNSLGSFMSFMNKYFGTQIKYANFSTNLHLELYLEKKENKEITENDYRIEYYYNDDFLLSIPYIEFKNKIQKDLFNSSLINNFCKVEKKDEDEDEDEDEDKDEKDNEEKSVNWYMIGTLISVVIIVILVIFIIIILKRRVKNNNVSNEEDEDKANLLRDTNRSSQNSE